MGHLVLETFRMCTRTEEAASVYCEWPVPVSETMLSRHVLWRDQVHAVLVSVARRGLAVFRDMQSSRRNSYHEVCEISCDISPSG